jgi:purine nucleosidase
LLAFLGRVDVPVFVGADRPLQRDPVFAIEVHGAGGMGRAILPVSTADAQEDAVGFLVETLSARSGEVVVIAVGPLTNLALAEQCEPGVLKKAKQVIVMGGSIAEPGNSSPTAEFNFYADPHAAQLLIRSGANVVLVPLDATHQVMLRAADIETQIVPLATERSQFVVDAVHNVLALYERGGREPVVYFHDPLAVGMAIAPALLGVETVPVDVETEGVLTLGQVVADLRVAPSKGYRGIPTDCVMKVNAEGFLSLFLDRVLELR